jgi:formylglycine-generating enzyme required for sulfatase activity
MRKGAKGKKIALLAGCGMAVVLYVFVQLHWEEIRFWYLLGDKFESVGKNARGYREYRHRRTGILMVKLPGGSAGMKKRLSPGTINFKVTVSPFLIGKFEVSQAEWKRVMANNPSRFPGDDHPVDSVSWNQCRDFCEQTGLKLPTEAQWEYACGAPGDEVRDLAEIAWYVKNSGRTTQPVGRKKANRFGLHDTQGNLYEWCEDLLDPKFYSSPEAREPDPVCRSGNYPVFRGGSWSSSGELCLAKDYGADVPSAGRTHIGFRVAYYPLP